MRLSFLGDTVLDKKYRIDFDLGEFIFNLEAPLSCDGTPAKYKVNICQKGSFMKETFGSLPIGVSLANNHIMDFGEEAFKKTKETLIEKKILYFGAGIEAENFNNPIVIQFGDKKIGLCGYCCASTHPVLGNNIQNGSAILKIDDILKDIKRLKGTVDFIVIQPHWGIQEVPFPKFSDVEIAHRLIDSGADMIIGHHAHVIQSHEIYKNKHIFYGVGNFIFPDLDIPTQYDGEKFTAKRIKKQEIEHRRSIVVTLDENLKVDYFTVLLKDGKVQKSKFSIPTWIPLSENDFQKKLMFWNKKNMLLRFIRNPKVPNLNHIKDFISYRRGSSKLCKLRKKS